MLLLRDIRDCMASLKIAADDNCYCGKLNNKATKSIGVYNLKANRKNNVPIGGTDCKSYGTKAISLLVHWSKSPTETETAAIRLHEALEKLENAEINGKHIKFVELMQEEPICVDMDDSGIYEYVIECIFYYERMNE